MQRIAIAALLTLLLGHACARTPMPADPDNLGWALHVPHGSTLWPELEPGTPFPEMPWPMSVEQARIILERAGSFDQGGDRVPPHAVAFNILLDSSDPRAEFEKVALSGTPAGQLYALCGYQLLDSGRYMTFKEQLTRSMASVDVLSGCIRTTRSVPTVVGWVAMGGTATGMRAARGALYNLVNGLANTRLNATATAVTGVSGATPAPAAPAR